uniref:11-beta-hydroxysteroid dehydrogenase-like 5 n=1 Tax=Vitis vinifera TaxID=29760 RepID=A5AVD2_VITVI|nr:hypothetical protein VITISV_028806 [Vitis vinifera]
MDLINSLLNLVVPPASLVMLAFAWPALSFINACEWVYNTLYSENMEDKVVIITGASSGIGEQVAYEYAKKGAKLVLVARRENRLLGIGENARQLGAKHVMIMAADVVKLDDCRRFVTETVNYYGRVDHLVNMASLGHTFYFEEAIDTSVFPPLMDINFWGNVYPTYVALPFLRQSNGRVIVNASVENWLPLPRMSLYARKRIGITIATHGWIGSDMTRGKFQYVGGWCLEMQWKEEREAAKAALINFYETLRFEAKEVGITIATHGWIGSDMTRGKFMLEDGAEMQWKEEREVTGGPVEEFARLMVAGACRGDAYVKYPSWYDIFLLYRVFAPNVLGWTFRLLLSTNGARRSTSLIGTGRPLLESSSPPKLLTGGPFTFPQHNPQQHQQKME